MTAQQFHSLYLEYAPRLLKGCRKIFRESDVEDVVQQVFQQVWDKKVQADDYERCLFVMACNILKNQIRHESKTDAVYRQFLLDQECDKDPYGSLPPIDKLPPQQRRVIELKLAGVEHHADIARILQVSLSTVNNHIVAAYKFLRNSIKDEFYTRKDPKKAKLTI